MEGLNHLLRRTSGLRPRRRAGSAPATRAVVAGPSLIGMRRSRSVKSLMVIGVVAVVASYAGPAISAAAATGGTSPGLP